MNDVIFKTEMYHPVYTTFEVLGKVECKNCGVNTDLLHVCHKIEASIDKVDGLIECDYYVMCKSCIDKMREKK